MVYLIAGVFVGVGIAIIVDSASDSMGGSLKVVA